MNRPVALILAILAGASPAAAGEATEAVRRFYEPVEGGEWLPEHRDRFTEPAVAIFEKNDKLSNNGEELGCLDFALSIDAQDYDQETVDRTLGFSEVVTGDQAEVTATFEHFPDQQEEPSAIVWNLRRIDGAWKVADIASPERGWRLSEFDCE
ncbi:MAG TPA: hypothetical protein VGN97_22305 [Mesorhizobium sp.]|jgi:hypothetical protein|nr:hypothetical protein [Mesorhizobium sp.]